MLLRQPFIGYEGQYFTNLLRAAGVDRSKVYITNTVHVQPPKNDYTALSEEELEAGKQQLIQDLTAWKAAGLTTVVAVGDRAFRLLTGKSGIYAYRGTVLPCALVEGLKVYATIHPGSILRGEGKYEPIFILDVKKAVADSETSTIHYPPRHITIIDNPYEAICQLQSVTERPEPVAVDIETAGPAMIAFGVATSPNEAFVLSHKLLKLPEVLRAIGTFASSSTPKIFHNALFDVFHGAFYYCILYRNIYFDTMIAQHTVYPTLPKGLGFCASIYTNEPYWKMEGKEALDEVKRGRLSWDKLYLYNGKDCCLTYEIYHALKTELSDWNVIPLFRHRMDLLPACLYAQMMGLILDKDECAKFADRNERAIANLEKVVSAVVGDINIRSPKQMADLLYKQWGFPINTRDGKVTTDEKKLKRLASMPTPYSAIIYAILALKERYKMRNFYNVQTDMDGRVRCSIKITGTYTGRLATSTSITGSGYNMQNVPKEVRVIYKADPGKIMVQCDLSQSEARIVAALCGDLQWLRDFDEKDLHTEVAALLYNIPPEKVNKETHRAVAKRVAHGTHYGMGHFLLSEILETSPKEAKRLRERYYEIRPSLKEWHSRVKQTILKDRMIRTDFGVVIQFFGPIRDKVTETGAVSEVMRNALAAEPQSDSVMYLNQGLVRCFNEIPEFDFRMQVHDSILFEVDDDIETLKRVLPKVKSLIEQPVTINGISMVIPLNFEIGYSWGRMIEMKSLDELEETYRKLN